MTAQRRRTTALRLSALVMALGALSTSPDPLFAQQPDFAQQLDFALQPDFLQQLDFAQPSEPSQLSESQAPITGRTGGTLRGALVDSFRLLTIQHTWRTAFEAKTRRELGGPFFGDYRRSLRTPERWSDGDSWVMNNVGHPVQGAASGFIWLNNSGRAEEMVPRDTGYWRSRLAATGWAAAYSLQFEVGPMSEASIGNVGLRRHTLGWTDHVMTPLGGLAFMVAEDAIDRYVLLRLERRAMSPLVQNSLRMFLNPSRSIANVARVQAPWHRSRPPAR